MRLADPIDQATGLRRLFAAEPAFHALGVMGPDARRNARASAALAVGLGRRGHRVLVLDETRPPHNVGGQLGVVPRYGLADAVARGLVAVAQPAGEGIVLLAAHDAPTTLAELSEQRLLDLAEDWLEREEAPEWMILNGSVGPLQVDSLATTAAMRVLVLPASKTRLADAYAVMKMAQSARPGDAWLVFVEGEEAVQARALFQSLRDTARRFLGVVPEFLGSLPREQSGNAAATIEASLVDALAGEVAACPAAERVNFEQYWQRMWLYSRLTAEAAGKRVQNARRSTG